MANEPCRILIIDDSPDDRAELRKMLLTGSNRHYQFTERALGATGLQQLRSDRERLPDCVLLDYHLPDMNAEEVLAELRAGSELPPCPVVVITGGDQESGAKILRAGAQDYLDKSWSTSESLTRAVENAMERFILITERTRAETKLRESEEQLRLTTERFGLALHGSTIVVFCQDLDLRYTWIYNPILGYSADQMLGKSDHDLFERTEDAAVTAAIKRDVIHTGVRRKEEVRIHSRGAEYYYDLTVEPLRDGKGTIQGVTCAAIDISERKHSEALLLASRRNLRAVYNGAQEYIGLLMLDGTLLEANPASLAFANSKREEVVGKLFWETVWFQFTPGAPEAVRNGVQRAGAGEFVRFEADLITPTQAVMTFEISMTPIRDEAGQVILIVPEGRDITERKKIEEALRQSKSLAQARQAELETLMDAIPAAVFIAHDPECRRMTGTPKGLEMLRLPPGSNPSTTALETEAVGFEIWVGGRRLAPEEMPMHRAAATGRGIYGVEEEVIFSNGDKMWLFGSALPLFDESNRVRGCVGVFQDITDRKRAEAALASAHELLGNEAKQLEKLVEKRTADLHATVQQLETFSYSVVHDMRAPLRSMRSFASFLEAEYHEKLDAQAQDYLRRIVASAVRLDGLIMDVLVYSRLGSVELKMLPVNLDELVTEIVQQYPQFQEMASSIQIQHPLPNVLGNKTLLTQVISNLLGNALKFVPINRPPRVVVRSELIDGKARIAFEDEGIGIASEYHEKIFGLFQRLHRPDEYAGTGVGLAIVKKAIERMDGKIGLESEPGKGSRFWIELPNR